MFTVKCPKCSTKTNLAFYDTSYQGPFRCWKCRTLFRVVIQNNKLKACEHMNEDELEKELDS